MAKRNKKRRIRRAQRSARNKMRHRNPGNFVKPTAKVADAHLKHWAKQGVTSAKKIKEGMIAPHVGKLTSDKDVKLAKVRFTEAFLTDKMYKEAAENYNARMVEWKEAKKAGVTMPKPAKPTFISKAKSVGRAGNFRAVSSKRARTYLEKVFRFNLVKAPGATSVKDLAEIENWMKNLVDRPAENWIRAKVKAGQLQQGLLGARLAEAITVIGPAEAAKIYLNAQTNFLRAADKAAKDAKDKDAAKAERLQKEIKKLEETLSKRKTALAAIAARARARLKKAKKSARSMRRKRKSRRSKR